VAILRNSYLLAALCIFLASPAWGATNQLRPQSVINSYLPANRQVQLRLCDPDAQAGYPHYYHLNFTFPSGHSYSPAATPGVDEAIAGDTITTPAGETCQNISIFTSGVGASSNYSINIKGCVIYPATGRRCDGRLFEYQLVTPVNPALAASSPSVAIGPVEQTFVETIALTPGIATLPITYGCTPQYGAQVSITPSIEGSQITDNDGKAYFKIVASVVNPTPGQTPSASCQFSTAGGANVATVSLAAPTFNPSLSALPPSVTQMNGTTPITVRTQTYPAYPNMRINASCQTSIVSASVISPRFTDAAGTAIFNVVTSLTNPVPGQAPSGSCKFWLESNSGYSSTVNITGQVYQPTLAITPSLIQQAGSVDVSAQVTSAAPGVFIDATCQTSRASASVSPASQVTNASGVAHFTVNSSELVIVDPNTNIAPAASCTFKVRGGTGQAALSFITGNACTYGLQPAPPGCGNP
jgi:hypothetical protein